MRRAGRELLAPTGLLLAAVNDPRGTVLLNGAARLSTPQSGRAARRGLHACLNFKVSFSASRRFHLLSTPNLLVLARRL